jgi:hypothetical protein
MTGSMDEGMQAALERMAEIALIMALPEKQAVAQLAAVGLFPVSVSHGFPEDDQAAALIDRLARVATRTYGSTHRRGKNEATTYLFGSPDAAVGFAAAVLGFAASWWIITFTANPVYPGGGGLTDAVSAAAASQLAAGLISAASEGATERIADELAAGTGPVPDQDYDQLRARAATRLGTDELLIAAFIRGYRKETAGDT